MEAPANLTLEQTIRALSSMVGEYVWFVRCREDHILTLDLGQPHLTVYEPRATDHGSEAVRAALGRRVVIPTGKWHLFIDDGDWCVEAGGVECKRPDDQSKINKCLNQLDGQRLSRVEYVPDGDKWVFEFDLSGRLSISPSKESDEDSPWTVFFEDGSYLSYQDPEHISLYS